jgi:hypothetical protein
MKAFNLLSVRAIRSALFFVCFVTISLTLLSYDTGPSAGYCNAPGDNDCASCHNSYSLVTTSGIPCNSISLTPVSASMSSLSHGVTYTFHLTFQIPQV